MVHCVIYVLISHEILRGLLQQTEVMIVTYDIMWRCLSTLALACDKIPCWWQMMFDWLLPLSMWQNTLLVTDDVWLAAVYVTKYLVGDRWCLIGCCLCLCDKIPCWWQMMFDWLLSMWQNTLLVTDDVWLAAASVYVTKDLVGDRWCLIGCCLCDKIPCWWQMMFDWLLPLSMWQNTLLVTDDVWLAAVSVTKYDVWLCCYVTKDLVGDRWCLIGCCLCLCDKIPCWWQMMFDWLLPLSMWQNTLLVTDDVWLAAVSVYVTKDLVGDRWCLIGCCLCLCDKISCWWQMMFDWLLSMWQNTLLVTDDVWLAAASVYVTKYLVGDRWCLIGCCLCLCDKIPCWWQMMFDWLLPLSMWQNTLLVTDDVWLAAASVYVTKYLVGDRWCLIGCCLCLCDKIPCWWQMMFDWLLPLSMWQNTLLVTDDVWLAAASVYVTKYLVGDRWCLIGCCLCLCDKIPCRWQMMFDWLLPLSMWQNTLFVTDDVWLAAVSVYVTKYLVGDRWCLIGCCLCLCDKIPCWWQMMFDWLLPLSMWQNTLLVTDDVWLAAASVYVTKYLVGDRWCLIGCCLCLCDKIPCWWQMMFDWLLSLSMWQNTLLVTDDVWLAAVSVYVTKYLVRDRWCLIGCCLCLCDKIPCWWQMMFDWLLPLSMWQNTLLVTDDVWLAATSVYVTKYLVGDRWCLIGCCLCLCDKIPCWWQMMFDWLLPLSMWQNTLLVTDDVWLVAASVCVTKYLVGDRWCLIGCCLCLCDKTPCWWQMMFDWLLSMWQNTLLVTDDVWLAAVYVTKYLVGDRWCLIGCCLCLCDKIPCWWQMMFDWLLPLSMWQNTLFVTDDVWLAAVSVYVTKYLVGDRWCLIGCCLCLCDKTPCWWQMMFDWLLPLSVWQNTLLVTDDVWLAAASVYVTKYLVGDRWCLIGCCLCLCDKIPCSWQMMFDWLLSLSMWQNTLLVTDDVWLAAASVYVTKYLVGDRWCLIGCCLCLCDKIPCWWQMMFDWLLPLSMWQNTLLVTDDVWLAAASVYVTKYLVGDRWCLIGCCLCLCDKIPCWWQMMFDWVLPLSMWQNTLLVTDDVWLAAASVYVTKYLVGDRWCLIGCCLCLCDKIPCWWQMMFDWLLPLSMWQNTLLVTDDVWLAAVSVYVTKHLVGDRWCLIGCCLCLCDKTPCWWQMMFDWLLPLCWTDDVWLGAVSVYVTKYLVGDVWYTLLVTDDVWLAAASVYVTKYLVGDRWCLIGCCLCLCDKIPCWWQMMFDWLLPLSMWQNTLLVTDDVWLAAVYVTKYLVGDRWCLIGCCLCDKIPCWWQMMFDWLLSMWQNTLLVTDDVWLAAVYVTKYLVGDRWCLIGCCLCDKIPCWWQMMFDWLLPLSMWQNTLLVTDDVWLAAASVYVTKHLVGDRWCLIGCCLCLCDKTPCWWQMMFDWLLPLSMWQNTLLVTDDVWLAAVSVYVTKYLVGDRWCLIGCCLCLCDKTPCWWQMMFDTLLVTDDVWLAAASVYQNTLLVTDDVWLAAASVYVTKHLVGDRWCLAAASVYVTKHLVGDRWCLIGCCLCLCDKIPCWWQMMFDWLLPLSVWQNTLLVTDDVWLAAASVCVTKHLVGDRWCLIGCCLCLCDKISCWWQIMFDWLLPLSMWQNTLLVTDDVWLAAASVYVTKYFVGDRWCLSGCYLYALTMWPSTVVRLSLVTRCTWRWACSSCTGVSSMTSGKYTWEINSISSFISTSLKVFYLTDCLRKL